MRWHADAGERCEVCLSCNVPIMFRWTKRDGLVGCVTLCVLPVVPSSRRVALCAWIIGTISVASVKLIKRVTLPVPHRVRSRSSPRTQFAVNDNLTHRARGTAPRELEIITAPESSPRRTRARSPPRRFRDPLAIPRSLMAISHSTHGRLTQRPITHGMDPSAVRQPPKSSLIFQRLAPRRRQHHVLLVIVAKQVGEEAGHFGARTHRCHPLVLVARGARDAHGQLVGQQA